MPHPAALLLTWLGWAIALQILPASGLLWVVPACLLAAGCMAPARSLQLLRRVRWLLLTLALLYAFATPGEYLPGPAGALGLTVDGLQQGALQIGRLLALLASLALLHEAVGTRGLLTGFYWLLRPLPWRETTVVRLLLVIEFAETQQRPGGWRHWLSPPASETVGPGRIALELPAMQLRDRLLIGAVCLTVLAMVWRS